MASEYHQIESLNTSASVNANALTNDNAFVNVTAPLNGTAEYITKCQRITECLSVSKCISECYIEKRATVFKKVKTRTCINSCFRLKNRAKRQHGFSINTYGIGKRNKSAHYTETSARNL